jgi:hypothetical protein
MKIGIISFFDSNDNYGQLLQCYALQQVLIERGHEPYHLRYAGHFEAYPLLWNFLRKAYFLLFHPVRTYWQVLKSHQRLCPQRRFDEFRKKHLLFSPVEYRSYRDLQNKCDRSLSIFISGSDQVWVNLNKHNKASLAYLLNFVAPGQKRVAYAASFGLPVNKRNRTFVARKLRPFDHIGVREKGGKIFCDSCGINSSLVCDPTLLVSKNTYDRLISEARAVGKHAPFAFCYRMGARTDFQEERMSFFCRENHLLLRTVWSQPDKEVTHSGEELTIPDWLKAYQDAEFIFTNSYHGTIFAVLMHKNFMVFPLSGATAPMNDRLYTLLEILDLKERLYDSEKQNFETIISNPIDWGKVNWKLEEYRNTSMNYLMTCGL